MPSSRSEEDTIPSPRDPLRTIMWGGGGVVLAAAVAFRYRVVLPTATLTAGPFLTLAVVIAGAAVLERLGVLRLLARTLVPDAAPPRTAFVRVLLLAAVLSGLVNLDVAVVVAMPVAIRVARRTGIAAGSLAIAVAATANASSFLLPTSNLTNLLVMDRAPIGFAAYVGESWIAWIGVVVLAIVGLTLVLGHGEERAEVHETEERIKPLTAMLDLIPLFLAATGLRALLGTGLVLPGGFAEQAGLGSLLAAGVNNLPAAAAMHALSRSSAWAAVLAMAIGPNLLVTGSLATVICRSMAREAGAVLDPVRFSLVGLALTPVLLVTAFVGLRIGRIL
ncbi:MAG: SLC13 family permease [Actinomycetota bacterium]